MRAVVVEKEERRVPVVAERCERRARVESKEERCERRE